MKLIVGLGNPGSEYNNTRHNVGFMVIDAYLKKRGITKLKNKMGGLYYEFNHRNVKVIVLKPQEYINLSGIVIKKYMNYYDIGIDDILVVNDDLDLDIGEYKLKPFGGSAGHNGLKNIEENLNSNQYKRLKIGISNNKDIDTKDYVLGKFSSIDKENIDAVVEECVNILDSYLDMTFSDLMTNYNKKQG